MYTNYFVFLSLALSFDTAPLAVLPVGAGAGAGATGLLPWPCPPFGSDSSDNIPADAVAIPSQPMGDNWWPCKKIERSTLNTFRVVVTVVQTKELNSEIV